MNIIKENHPDRNPNKEDADDKMALLAKAHKILGTPETKSVYDKHGSKVRMFVKLLKSPNINS